MRGRTDRAQRYTHFLNSPRIAQIIDKSDFAFADLKDKLATIFLTLPLRPVLFLLDEFAALGRWPRIERAMGLMAGYGSARS